jgi:hypothetical protein
VIALSVQSRIEWCLRINNITQLNKNQKKMETIKKFAMSKTGALIAGVLLGTIAGGYVRKAPYLNRLPQVG